MSRLLIVPAAGRGTRLGAGVPKALVPVNGTPMLRRVLQLHRPWADRAVVVASPDAQPSVRSIVDGDALPTIVAVQRAPTGMLDAILIGAAAGCSDDVSRVWITWADQVAVDPRTLTRLAGIEAGTDLALPTVWRTAPYIHFERDATGRITRVLQHREGDAMPARGESDIGVFSLASRACFEELPEYGQKAAPGPRTGERNFLPFMAWLAARGVLASCPCTDPREAIGINTPEELAAISAYLASR